MDLQKELTAVTQSLLKEMLTSSELSISILKYKELLIKIIGEEIDSEEGRSNLKLGNGEAIGTFWAATCLEDALRTRKFIRGIDAAVQEQIQSEKTIHILYAGTGPFATLLLPIILKYKEARIKFTLMEINSLSFTFLRKVLSELKLFSDRITLIHADATEYIFPKNEQPDIIVSETMQNALAKEPQVPIFLNLMRQAKPETVFIPEKIQISIGVGSSSNEESTANTIKKERNIFEVSKKAMLSGDSSEILASDGKSFQTKTTTIPSEHLQGFDQLLLITEIQVYKDEWIRVSESGLTVPLIIDAFSKEESFDLNIETQYLMSAEPELAFKVKKTNQTEISS